jgi:hypothetical protein
MAGRRGAKMIRPTKVNKNSQARKTVIPILSWKVTGAGQPSSSKWSSVVRKVLDTITFAHLVYSM